MEPKSISDIPTTGLALTKAHPLVPHNLNNVVAMISIIIVSVTTTSTYTLRTFLAAIATFFIYSFSSFLFQLHFSIAGNLSLIASLLAIRKQTMFSKIKTLGRMFELPFRTMTTGDIPGVGYI